jgi:hypothetical protein
VTRVYSAQDACGEGCRPSEVAQAAALSALQAAGGRFVSAFVRAHKPVG